MRSLRVKIDQGVNDIVLEGIREYNACIACRFCLGYCPVWDELDNLFFRLKKESVDQRDLEYFAYLCHDCRNCYYACPYKPPHEISINIPKVNSQMRLIVDEKYIRPKFMAKALKHQYTYEIGLFSIFFTLALIYVIIERGLLLLSSPIKSIYNVMPNNLIDTAGLVLGIWGISILIYEGLLYWKGLGENHKGLLNIHAHLYALRDSFFHTWFKANGEGCDYPGEYGSFLRFYSHLSLFLGMIIDFLATIIAAYEQDLTHTYPFYPIISAPVLLGITGGILILIGTSLLSILKKLSNKELIDNAWLEIDNSMLYLLMAIALSGFIILILRHFPFEGLLFIIHISLVATLFTITPHSKLIHIIFRYLALLHNYNNKSVYNHLV